MDYITKLTIIGITLAVQVFFTLALPYLPWLILRNFWRVMSRWERAFFIVAWIAGVACMILGWFIWAKTIPSLP